MTDEIFKQILKIRNSGFTNMLDCYAVQKIAFKNNFFELVNYIEENKNQYFNFIIYGSEYKSEKVQVNKNKC